MKVVGKCSDEDIKRILNIQYEDDGGSEQENVLHLMTAKSFREFLEESDSNYD